MKKIVILVLWIITMALAFYAGSKYQKASNEKESVSKTDGVTAENVSINGTDGAIAEFETVQTFDDVVEIPISDIEKIAEQDQECLTQQEAETLCRDVLGDKAEENGFPISYRCISAVSANGNLYYVMNISWLVNNSHWSYIGNCYVSYDGQEIYDGVVTQGKYEITGSRWKK